MMKSEDVFKEPLDGDRRMELARAIEAKEEIMRKQLADGLTRERQALITADLRSYASFKEPAR